MAWATSIQIASFKGIVFDVLSVEDSIERGIVEHHYACAEGADIEDMGAMGHEVNLVAIFYGEAYEHKLTQLLNCCYESGAGLLVHPILGRLPNMQLVSSRFNHEAENVDYVEFTLSFKKATKGKPLFEAVSLFGALDQILNQIESMAELADQTFTQFIQRLNTVNQYKSRVRAMTAMTKNIWYELETSLNDLNLSSHQSTHSFIDDTYQQAITLSYAKNVTNPISARSEYDSVIQVLNEINALPENIAKGNSTLDLGVPLTQGDAKEIIIIVEMITLCIRIKCVIDIFERDELSPPEIEILVNDVRKMAQQTIDKIRENKFIEGFNDYDGFYQLVDSIRISQHQLKEIAKAIISKKPPFIVRLAPFDGTLHQIAFHFYNDFKRYDELIKLNPHLTHPSFIKKGDFINGYAE